MNRLVSNACAYPSICKALSRSSSRRSWCGSRSSRCSVHGFAVDSVLWAVTDDVSSFSTFVASLAGSVQCPTIGSSAVFRDVAELAARVALLSLSLAIACKVVWSTTLVAHSRASTESTTSSCKTATSSADWHNWGSYTRCWTVASQVANLTTRVASSSSSAANTECWAICLNVP